MSSHFHGVKLLAYRLKHVPNSKDLWLTNIIAFAEV